MPREIDRLPWRDIDSAPRDGTVVIVFDPDCGAFPMRWVVDGVNPLVDNPPGIWVASDGSMTWDASRGFGPTK